MSRTAKIAGLLLFAGTPALLAQKNAAKEVRPAPSVRTLPPRAPGPAGKKERAAPRINNPGLVVQQLMRMTPEERERAIEKFPPQRQAQIRQRLQRFDDLPQQQRDRMIKQYEMLSSLPPEKQTLVRRQMQTFNRLPRERRQTLGPELQRLRRMPADERQALVNSEAFKNKYTPEEQQMLFDISQNLPLDTR